MSVVPGWTVARFAGTRLDRRRRELVRDGSPQALAPRAFEVLIALIEQHGRVVSKDALIGRCWNGEAGNDAALARIVMQLRRSFGDIGDAVGVDRGDCADVITTVRGVGYRFDAPVKLSDEGIDAASTAPQKALAAARRVALLPFVNDTGQPGFAWIELGLASMLGKSIEASAGVAVAAVPEVLAALAGLPPDAAPEWRAKALQQHLDPDLQIEARLGGSTGHLSLHFELRDRGGERRRSGSVSGADATALALEASKQLTRWLLPDESEGPAAALDFGDAFVNETFARALQKSREGRMVEAAHLLEVVTDGRLVQANVQLEVAKVNVALGGSRAAADVEALRRAALSEDNAAMLAQAGLLSSRLAWQRGEMMRAADDAADAATDAERAGRPELAVQCLIEAARGYGHALDPRAAALISRAIPQAERLGNRLWMRQAYTAASTLRGFSNDWVGALGYAESALAIAHTMAEATRSPALEAISRATTHLGLLHQGSDFGLEAVRCAHIAGAQPELGEAATAAVYALFAARRVVDAAALFRELQRHPDDQTPPMVIARDVFLRAVFLRLTGHFDDALKAIEAADKTFGNRRAYRMVCELAKLRVLLQARRMDEVMAHGALLTALPEYRTDPMREPWVECMLALVDHLAFGDTAKTLARQHALLARLPPSEPQARIAMDAAWLHLERGEPVLAEKLFTPLHNWLEHSDAGPLLRARLHHECGRFEAAVAEQRRFTERYAATLSPFTASLLEIYEQAERSGRRQAIAPIILSIEFGLAPWVVRQLPPELGGPATPSGGSAAQTG